MIRFQQAMPRSVTRIPTNTLPDPILLDEHGQPTPVRIWPAKLKLKIDQQYASQPSGPATRPGDLSKFLMEADQNAPVSPRLTLAVGTAAFDVERPVAEMSILGQWGSDFPENHDKLVAYNALHNGFPMPATASLEKIEAQGERMVHSYIACGLIKKDDNVIDVGTALGFVPKHLKAQGVANVVAIEPDIDNIRQRVRSMGKNVDAETRDILPLSLEQYIEENKGRKFSIVNVSNFSPKVLSPEESKKIEGSDISNMAKFLANITASDGKALVGVNSINREYVSGKLGRNLRPFFEEYFGKVEYIKAKTFTEEYNTHLSVGGQMGVFACSEPKTA